MKLLVLSSMLVSFSAFSQDMSAADNKCRAEAKEIAIKSYQSCVTTARTARLETIRKEYQAKLAEVKKQYEAQLQELKRQNKKSAANQTVDQNEPTVTLKKANNGKKPSKIKSLTANNIITEAELEKAAPIEPVSEDTIQTAEKNEATGEVEKLEVVDPSLPATQTK